MRKSMPAIALSVALTLLLCTPVLAVPIEINYQGYLTDSGGTPVNGTTNITFNLYSAVNLISLLPGQRRWR